MVYWTEFNYDSLPTTTATYRRDHKYSPLIGCFDLESTNYHDIFSFMYVWQFGIEDQVVYGRTWNEFREFLANLKAEMHLNVEHKLIVFDHNLKFDFGFFCREVPVDGKLIAKSRHEVLLCTVFDCFEFHDSYNYSEKSLDAMGLELGLPKIQGFDYSKLRHAQTELDPDELRYISRDCEILLRYFAREAEHYGNVGKIPLTATQRVKRVLSERMAANDSKSKYMYAKIRKRQLDTSKPGDNLILKMLRMAFFGGFNYCTTMYKNQLHANVDDYDADSHYIAQILLHRFPIDNFKPIEPPRTWEQLKELLNGKGIYQDKAMLITFQCESISARLDDVGFLPIYTKNYIGMDLCDRRSMVSKKMHTMGHFETTLTDIDFRLMFKYYNVGKITVKSVFASRYGALPDYVRDTCTELYQKKSSAKAELREIKKTRRPTAEEQAAYDLIKSFLNRIYGIFVQDPVRTNYYFDGTRVAIDKENRITTKDTRFAPVLYQWGVWVSAWARYELLSLFWALTVYRSEDGKLHYNHKVLYCDTDSLKGKDLDTSIIARYNANVKSKVLDYCTRRRIPFETLDGLGEFKREHYDYFKTIGQKQYAFIDENGNFAYHISGLAQPKQGEDGKEHCFFDQFETLYEKMEAFCQDMRVPADQSGLLESIFGSERAPEVVEDCNGDKLEIHVLSFVLLLPKGYKASEDLDEMLQDIEADRIKMLHQKFMQPCGGNYENY